MPTLGALDAQPTLCKSKTELWLEILSQLPCRSVLYNPCLLAPLLPRPAISFHSPQCFLAAYNGFLCSGPLVVSAARTYIYSVCLP
jgi:hypothetical protein